MKKKLLYLTEEIGSRCAALESLQAEYEERLEAEHIEHEKQSPHVSPLKSKDGSGEGKIFETGLNEDGEERSK